jgi:hypothetical protein
MFIKRRWFVLLSLLALLSLSSCTQEPLPYPQIAEQPDITEPTPVPTPDVSEEVSIVEETVIENTYESEWCYCGVHHADEPVKQPSPPLNISEVLWDWSLNIDEAMILKETEIHEFVKGFDFVHEHTYLQWDEGWVNSIVLWPDETLRDFSFVSLTFDGYNVYSVAEILLTIDELPPTQAVVLNVAFEHYLFPRGGIIFTEESGEQRRMFIQESMAGGCIPHFHLVPHENVSWAVWE